MDDSFFLLLALLALALPVCAVAGFFMALGQRARLRLLEQRLAFVEAKLGAAGPQAAFGAVPEAEPPPEPESAPAAGEAGIATPEAPPAEEPVSEPPSPDLPEVPPPSRPAAGFEERLGTRWAVWVGGVALALGGLFLVRYSIEQGLLGPGARVAAGALFALALLGAGEWLRRRDRTATVPGIPSAYVPGVLTAAGTSTAFATVYAAHALYGLIGPGGAFVLLGAIALGTLLAATLHGPALAALGLVAALASPLLVASDEPRLWPLVPYLAFVVATAYGVARLRLWKRLALAAAIGAIVWTWLLGIASRGDLSPVMAHILVEVALAGLFLVADPHRGTPDEAARPDRFAGGVLTAFAAFTALLAASSALGAVRPAFTAAVALMMLGFACRFAPAAIGAAAAALVAVGTLLVWPVAEQAAATPKTVLPDFSGAAPYPEALRTYLVFAVLLPLAIAAASLWRLWRGRALPLSTAAWFAGAATVGPLLALVAAYGRVSAFDRSISFALVAGFVGLAFAAVAARFRRAEGEADALRLATGATAAAAVAALALGLTFALDKGALTVAFALSALGTAWVADRLRLPVLRYAVGALALVVAGRLAYDPAVVGDDLGRTPIVNWLLWGYGVPALAFFLAARLLERSGRDAVVRFVESLSIAFSAFLVLFEIRHALTGGDPFAPMTDHLEMGLTAVASLVFALVLVRTDARRPDIIYRVGSLVFGVVSLLVALCGLVVADNPVLSGEPVLGSAVFNSLLPAYLLPALLAGLLARAARGVRPRWYVGAAAALSFVLGLLYVLLEIRRVFQGPSIGWLRATGEGEQWSYSLALLAVGILLLGVGLLRDLRVARLVAAATIGAAVVKVFVVDLASLEGVMRALSFIGLGLVLVAIGFAYQKLLARRAGPTAPGPQPGPAA